MTEETNLETRQDHKPTVSAPKPKRRWLRRVLWSIFGGIPLLLGVWVLVESWDLDGEPGSWVLRKLFHSGPRYFELSVDLTVEGDPMTITRVVQCKPYFRHQLDRHFIEAYYLEREAVTHRLPTGAGVLIVIPHSWCYKYADWQSASAQGESGAVSVPSTDYIPLIVWVDNTDNPQELEAYFSSEYYISPTARIRFHDIRVRIASNLVPSASREEFGRWKNAIWPGIKSYSRLRVGKNFFAIYAATAVATEIEEFPELTSSLNMLEKPALLTGQIKKLARSVLSASLPVTEVLRGRITENRIRKHQTPSLYGEMVPFQRRGEYLVPVPENTGMLFYYPISSIFANGRFVHGNVPLEISSKRFLDVQNIDNLYYDVKHGTLYSFTWSLLAFLSESEESGGAR